MPDHRRASGENLPFSISRLLSKTYSKSIQSIEDSDKKHSIDKELSDNGNKICTNLTNNPNIHYSGNGGLYTYPLYSPGGLLRVPPQRGCSSLTWALPPLHPAALAHQAVKDRLTGNCIDFFLLETNANILCDQ